MAVRTEPGGAAGPLPWLLRPRRPPRRRARRAGRAVRPRRFARPGCLDPLGGLIVRTVIPAQFQVGPAPWTAAIPGLPIALGGAIAIYELAFSLRPVAGIVLLTAGLGIYWLRQSSRVRIADGRLSMRWFSPTDQVVDRSEERRVGKECRS